MGRKGLVIAAAALVAALAAPAAPAAAQMSNCYSYTERMYSCSGFDSSGRSWSANGWRSPIGDNITINDDYGSSTTVLLPRYTDTVYQDGWQVSRCRYPRTIC